jgi:hypothetical protein
MKQMRFTLNLMIASVVLALAVACVPRAIKPLTVHQRYEAACVSAGAALGVITDINKLHPLPAATQARVLEIKRTIFDKRCKLAPGEDYPYTATEAVLSELEGAADNLETIEGEAK